MFIPLKMVLIGIDPYPYPYRGFHSRGPATHPPPGADLPRRPWPGTAQPRPGGAAPARGQRNAWHRGRSRLARFLRQKMWETLGNCGVFSCEKGWDMLRWLKRFGFFLLGGRVDLWCVSWLKKLALLVKNVGMCQELKDWVGAKRWI